MNKENSNGHNSEQENKKHWWFEKTITNEERFDEIKKFWTKKVEDEEVEETEFYNEMFHSERTPEYRSIVNDDMIFSIATIMMEPEIAKCEMSPASPAASTTPAARETATT